MDRFEIPKPPPPPQLSMSQAQARARYRRAVAAHRLSHPDEPMPVSFRTYARWLCTGVEPVGKLARICAKAAP